VFRYIRTDIPSIDSYKQERWKRKEKKKKLE
jgi:hypothetical protein